LPLRLLSKQPIGLSFAQGMHNAAGALVALEDAHGVLGVGRIKHEADGRA
jgi:hypothetical protein